jgi:hypothetical protein
MGGASASGGNAGNAGFSGASAGASGLQGGSSSTGGTGAAGTPGTAGANSLALSFEADVWPVFEMIRDPVFVYPGGTEYESCVTVGVCHGGSNPGARLSMTDPTTAYEMLLNVPSTSSLCDDTIRVVAGQPNQSCLIKFYEGRLRDELDWVDTAEIDLVREWIAQGALP